MTKTKVNWLIISISYLIAFGISSLFNSGYFDAVYKRATANYLITNWSFLPAGIGTLLAACFAFYFDRKTLKTISLFGNNTFKNITIALTPLLVFSITAFTQHDTSYGFTLAIVALIYALTEEIFWRGYLQDAFSSLGKNKSYVAIGVLWWAWHFRFNNAFDYTTFLPICIVSTFLLGKFTEETKSYLTSAGLHSLIILITSTGDMTNSKIIAGLITVLVWLSIGKLWKPKIQQNTI